MKKKVLIVAPHADDETLGCGGTILRHDSNGDEVNWLLVTSLSQSSGYSKIAIEIRKKEIEKVNKQYNFKSQFELNYSPAKLESLPLKTLIDDFKKVIDKVKPDTIYMPHFGDVHSDHRIICDAIFACTKSFRNKYIKSIIAYETISETEFNIKSKDGAFVPNLWINIEKFIDKKLEIMNTYVSEVSDYPFPRSKKNIISLSSLRGSNVGLKSAEAFMILKEIN
tara:strand:+ start:2134 stop:2805 length:672 start_codon:yes stop_codon:yes gene_type:complete